MIAVNSFTLAGRLTRDPEVDVIKSKMDGSGKTVVTFDIVYDHPHDRLKKHEDRRPQYITVRARGKTGEAAARSLRHGDEVLIVGGTRVQDEWVDQITQKTRRKEFLEPPPFGLQYLRVRSMKLGTPYPERVDKLAKED